MLPFVLLIMDVENELFGGKIVPEPWAPEGKGIGAIKVQL